MRTNCFQHSYVFWLAGALLPLFSPGLLTASDRGPRMLENARPEPPRAAASIRIDVDMTLVPVTVVDPLGRNVLGLGASNFRLFEEKQERDIATFSQEDAPVSVGIVFDRSGSMEANMRAARHAVAALADQLNPDDQTMLIAVADRPSILSDLSSTFSTISDALMFTKAGGTTALLDSVYLAIDRMRRAPTPRKAVIVISDGLDNASRYTERDLMSFASEAGVQVYTIGLADRLDPLAREGLGLLRNMTMKTGGQAFEITSATELVEAMARIGITLHNQYVLGFYPPPDVPAGKFRRIQVDLKVPPGVPRLNVYARRGYYAGK